VGAQAGVTKPGAGAAPRRKRRRQRFTLAARWRKLRAHPWWPWVSRGAAIAFLLLVASLVIVEARKVRWHDVLAALGAMPWTVLAIAICCAAASHVIYSAFDLIGRRYIGHSLPAPRVMMITFVSYAFNLNMGTLIGAAGIRFRLYSKLGLALEAITRIMTLAILTNWLGYLVLTGVLLLWRPFALPFEWMRARGAVDAVGIMLLALPIAYVAACRFSRRRVLQVRGHRLRLPTVRQALMQLVLSCANWMTIGALVYTLLQQRIEYPLVLLTLLVAAVSGVIAHVPAGLGVLEAVFVSILSDRLPKETLLAALLAYRAIYYILPLLVAALGYFLFEARNRRRRRAGPA
jgi:uncharacterized membrane protein YbhN (UPF0104 family)